MTTTTIVSPLSHISIMTSNEFDRFSSRRLCFSRCSSLLNARCHVIILRKSKSNSTLSLSLSLSVCVSLLFDRNEDLLLFSFSLFFSSCFLLLPQSMFIGILEFCNKAHQWLVNVSSATFCIRCSSTARRTFVVISKENDWSDRVWTNRYRSNDASIGSDLYRTS
jgi:hypothetical protein